LAAKKDISNAQVMLGVKYYKGEGVKQDFIQAYKWFYIAAQKGYEPAQKAIKLTSKHIKQSQVEEAIRLAKEENISSVN